MLTQAKPDIFVMGWCAQRRACRGSGAGICLFTCEVDLGAQGLISSAVLVLALQGVFNGLHNLLKQAGRSW